MKTNISLVNTIHSFHKKNLVTTSKGDIYRCDLCHIEGIRQGLSDRIFVVAPQKKIEQCVGQLAEVPTMKFVSQRIAMIQTVIAGGAENLRKGSIHRTLPCPKAERMKYGNGIWVLGIHKGKIVGRVLLHEHECKPA